MVTPDSRGGNGNQRARSTSDQPRIIALLKHIVQVDNGAKILVDTDGLALLMVFATYEDANFFKVPSSFKQKQLLQKLSWDARKFRKVRDKLAECGYLEFSLPGNGENEDTRYWVKFPGYPVQNRTGSGNKLVTGPQSKLPQDQTQKCPPTQSKNAPLPYHQRPRNPKNPSTRRKNGTKKNSSQRESWPQSISKEDLNDPNAVFSLYRLAVSLGYVKSCDTEKHRVFATAHHAVSLGKVPGALFTDMLKNNNRKALRNEDDDWASHAIKELHEMRSGGSRSSDYQEKLKAIASQKSVPDVIPELSEEPPYA